MGWPKCNQTEEYEDIDEVKLWKDMEFHHLGLILSALFGCIAIVMSLYLIFMHCTHYHKPWEQRHIIRILFMVPVYAFVSFVSYLFYRHAIYWEVLRDCYEAFAIASFFFLLCHYVAPNLHDQKEYFRTTTPRNWVWPLPYFQKCTGGQSGKLRVPRSGLTWFNVIYLGIFQYCFVRVFMTVVAVITQAFGIYCLESLNPAFAHIWVMTIEGVCVTFAMFCLIQFYVQLKDDLAEHRPLLKVAAIKLVIFLSFWQTLIISFLTSSGAIKPSKTIQTPDIKIGIPSMLICMEMAIFSILHLWAFPWQVYDVHRSAIVASESVGGYASSDKNAYQGGFLGYRALVDAFNPWDFVKAIGRAFRWLCVGRRARLHDTSYNKAGGSGLEPTRDNVHPALRMDGPLTASNQHLESGINATSNRGGRSHGASLSQDDQDHLLSHAQTNPELRPSTSASHSSVLSEGRQASHQTHRDSYTDNSAVQLTVAAPSYHPSHGLTVHSRGPSIDSQDTSYHSLSATSRPGLAHQSRSSVDHTRQSGIRPDHQPLGPPGRTSGSQAQWNLWGGISRREDYDRSEDERELGGGDHGMRDNRF